MPRRASAHARCAFTQGSPPLLVADGGGNRLRDVEPIGGQVDVEGDERIARADRPWRRRVGCGAGRAEVGRPARVAIFARQPLELARGGCPRGAAAPGGRRLLVEVDRHAEARRDRAPTRPRQRHAVGHRRRPSSGTNGTTSTAPIRGCSPWCVRRSMRGDRALEQRQHRAARAPPASPAKVKTDRLCDGSDE